ncbi:hypothetical protein B0H14DRAFT_3448839 [Mycena olivaceomarginata]|nr:hypothetical protein B0H14DRAFT_3448839 [Mycena olivaceomarginata]
MSDIPTGTRSNTATIPADLTPFEPATPALPEGPAAEAEGSDIGAGLMGWQWTGSPMKSIGEFKSLLGVLRNKRYLPADIMDFDEYLATSSTSSIRDGRKSASVKISVPDGKKYASEADAPVFEVPVLFYLPLVEVIKSAIHDVGDRCFHYTPFKKFWQPTLDGFYDEIYSSNAMVEAHGTAFKISHWSLAVPLSASSLR